MEKLPRISDFDRSLGPDDYEESMLLERWVELYRDAQKPRISFTTGKKEAQAQRDQEMNELLKLLGYDPSMPRPPRPRGRPRSDSMPKPLPGPGTELQNCFGEVYKVIGYAKTPRAAGDETTILYKDGSGKLVARSTIHLLTGTLGSGVPFVTYPGDPRGLKPGKPIPMNKRRTMTKRDLANDEHADPDVGYRRPKETFKRVPRV